MQCFECGSPAVALCPRCHVGQCANHLVQSQQWARRTGAIAGCGHRDMPTEASPRQSDIHYRSAR